MSSLFEIRLRATKTRSRELHELASLSLRNDWKIALASD
jgi:hypothetical protein